MYTITFSEDQIKLLKEALLCAEVNRAKEGSNSLAIELLHINIDDQLSHQDYLNR